jgi:uncharacterized protein (TIGR00255 family)
MTGYGRSERKEGHLTLMAEVRSVNNRYLEVASKLPRSMALRENEIKELVRSKFLRGKINIVVNISHENSSELPLKINREAVRLYSTLLKELKKTAGLKQPITIDHLLTFPEILEINEFGKGDEQEWALLQKVLLAALEETAAMRRREGAELAKDLRERIHTIEQDLDKVERLAQGRLPDERSRLETRLKELLTDQNVIDNRRLEFEIALFVDKLDVTEECVRFRCHNKFFLEDLNSNESAGRKLNFLIQEMNREANTIGSKANNAEIAHVVVAIKEELEKIREQLQNIE